MCLSHFCRLRKIITEFWHRTQSAEVLAKGAKPVTSARVEKGSGKYRTHQSQNRSRGGRSWPLTAGWIVLLLSSSSTVAFSDTVFVTSFRTAVETTQVVSHWRVPTFLTLLFRQWLTVPLVFMGRSARTSYSQEVPDPHPPFSRP